MTGCLRSCWIISYLMLERSTEMINHHVMDIRNGLSCCSYTMRQTHMNVNIVCVCVWWGVLGMRWVWCGGSCWG